MEFMQNMFKFQPRWKEELVCICRDRVFVLELPGFVSAYLPTEKVWKDVCPTWARDLWPVLKVELEAWCVKNNARFFIDETAGVFFDPSYPVRKQNKHGK